MNCLDCGKEFIDGEDKSVAIIEKNGNEKYVIVCKDCFKKYNIFGNSKIENLERE